MIAITAATMLRRAMYIANLRRQMQEATQELRWLPTHMYGDRYHWDLVRRRERLVRDIKAVEAEEGGDS